MDHFFLVNNFKYGLFGVIPGSAQGFVLSEGNINLVVHGVYYGYIQKETCNIEGGMSPCQEAIINVEPSELGNGFLYS